MLIMDSNILFFCFKEEISAMLVQYWYNCSFDTVSFAYIDQYVVVVLNVKDSLR